MEVLSLPVSMQQELAARALRACMAAEAAMASLRAECKPLQTVCPQRVLALNTKSMAHAHRSLQLQIEACENFSLSATSAFKQLCDVIFCGDSEKSINLEHKSILHENTHHLKSFKTQVSDLPASIDGELPVRGSWKFDTNAVEVPSKRSKDDGTGTSVSATTTRDHLAWVRVTEAQDTLCWEPENGASYTRFPSPETDNEATNREEPVERRSIKEADWNRQLDSQQLQDREDASQSGNEILMSKIDVDSDISDLDVDLSCDISPLRENSILSTNSSENQSLDDGIELHKTTKSSPVTVRVESAIAAEEHAVNCVPSHQPTTSNISELNTNLGDFEHEHHLNGSTKTSRLAGAAEAPFQQTLEGESPSCASDSHSVVSSHTATGSPPPASSSSNEVAKRCNSYKPIELEPATPLHESWTAAEVTSTQIPYSSASRFSWTCESTRSIETPSMTKPLSLLECNPRVPYALVERWGPSKTPSNLPLYPALRQSPEQVGMILAPASSSVRGLHQEHKPKVLSFERQDLAVHKLQPLFNREIGHSPPCPSHTDETHGAEPNVPLTPSPYTLEMRSVFPQANSARKPICGSSIPVPLKSSYGRSDGHLFSMATAVSLSSGNQQPSIDSGLLSGSSACVSVKEKQTFQIVSGAPPPTQFSVSPISSSISTSSLSRESPILSNNSRSDGSGREGSFEIYKKALENLQEQFPRAHGGFPVEPLSSCGSTRIGILASNPVVSSSLQNACETPWQTSHMRTTTTGVERHVGSGSTSEAKHISAQARPVGERGGHTLESDSDRSVGNGSKGSLESDSRYDGTVQGTKINDIQVSDVGNCGTSNRESCDMTSRVLSRIDCAQKPHSRPEATSWRWSHSQSDKETGVAVPLCRTSNPVVIAGSAGDCARGESIVKRREVCDSEDDDDDDSSTEREWKEILISMQQRGKP